MLRSSKGLYVADNTRPKHWRLRVAAKTYAFLFFLAVGPLMGYAQNITLKGDRLSLRQVFTAIKKQTNYAVVFNPDEINPDFIISVNAKQQPLDQFLGAALSASPYGFKFVGTTIAVFPLYASTSGSPMPAQQGHDLSGIVYDDQTSTMLLGVSVVAEGLAKATQTDEKGVFTFRNLPAGAKLTLTYIGYEKLVVTFNEREPFIYLRLKPAVSQLDEAVVQGYGITSRRLATGNIDKVSGEEIKRQPVMNPLVALQGKVPGLVITQLSGKSSAPLKVEIRGRNSLNPAFVNEPLYVIDGVPQTILNVKGIYNYNDGISPGVIQGGLSMTGGQSPLFNLNPKDIESIEVLKDGDATAIYGSRAANGVILITTKKGKAGRTALNVDLVQGLVVVPKLPRMLGNGEYLAMRREALKNDNLLPTAASAPDLMVWDTTRYTDWQKELLGTGKQTSISAGMSGGDMQTTFSIRANYTSQVDLYSRDGGNERATFLFNVAHRSANQRLGVNLSGNFSHSYVDAIGDSPSSFSLPPNAPSIFDEKGALNFKEWTEVGLGDLFPFSYILRPSVAKTNNLTSNLNLSYEIVKGFSASLNSGFTSMQNTNDWFGPIASQDPSLNPLGMAYFGRSRNSSWILEPQLRYSKFIGEGNLTAQAGGSLQRVGTVGTTISAFGYSNDDLLRSVSNAPLQQVAESASDYKYAAVFARINYNWKSKYIMNLNGRRDGSSRFAPDRRYGNFGSVGAAWIVTEENWLKHGLPSSISFIKLRASYGITGGDGIGDYQYLSQWSTQYPNSETPIYRYDNVQPYLPIHAVNQQYRWESVKNLEGALDLGLFDNRVAVEIAWYRKRCDNQLTKLPTPYFTGFPSVTANWSANVQNSGIEASLRARLIRKKNLSLSVNFNIAFNRNKLISYPGIESSPYANRYRVGESLGVIYVLHYTGVDPLTGNYTFEDRSKDGKIVTNYNVVPGTADDDRYVPVDLNPKYNGGITANMRYKGLDVFLSFSFMNQKGLHPFAALSPGKMNNLILPDEVINNHWRKPGDQALYARYSTLSTGEITGSDRAFINASYIRMNTAGVSYSLPDQLVKKAGLHACALSLNMQNLLTITRYKMDPEIRNGSFNPIPRIITTGLSFTF